MHAYEMLNEIKLNDENMWECIELNEYKMWQQFDSNQNQPP